MGHIPGLLALVTSLHMLLTQAAIPVRWQRAWHAGPVGIGKNASLHTPAPPSVVPVHHNISGIALPTRDQLRVDGGNIPLLQTRVQDSYAGRIPISSDESDNRTLFFWYWPSSAKHGSDALTIWLNGGPGCSSLGGFLGSHGAFTFKPGTQAPSVNPYAWSTISDMLYIDQPVSTGFSSGTSDAVNEYDVANQFYGFLRNLYTVFPELLSKRLFIAGESYAGIYIPYISQRIVTASPAEKRAFPIDLQSILINDALWTTFIFSQWVPMADFATAHQRDLGLNDSIVRAIQENSVNCGFQDVMDQLVYPPKGPIVFAYDYETIPGKCIDGLYLAEDVAEEINPCFNIYRVTDKCPTPGDPTEDYFSRADVQEALNVPGFGIWERCGGNPFPGGEDQSNLTDTLFPGLLKALPRGITLWHGADDMLLFADGTLLGIQNITWAGAQGFQRPVREPVILDGVRHGLQHSERGLTYYKVENAGHKVAEDQPKLALEVLRTVLGKGSLVHTNGGH